MMFVALLSWQCKKRVCSRSRLKKGMNVGGKVGANSKRTEREGWIDEKASQSRGWLINQDRGLWAGCGSWGLCRDWALAQPSSHHLLLCIPGNLGGTNMIPVAVSESPLTLRRLLGRELCAGNGQTDLAGRGVALSRTHPSFVKNGAARLFLVVPCTCSRAARHRKTSVPLSLCSGKPPAIQSGMQPNQSHPRRAWDTSTRSTFQRSSPSVPSTSIRLAIKPPLPEFGVLTSAQSSANSRAPTSRSSSVRGWPARYGP